MAAWCDPHEDVLSTYALDQPSSCESRFSGPGYKTLAGTLMATPHVAGVRTLLVQCGLSGSAAADRIRSTADDLGTPGTDPVFGSGRVNSRKAVSAGCVTIIHDRVRHRLSGSSQPAATSDLVDFLPCLIDGWLNGCGQTTRTRWRTIR